MNDMASIVNRKSKPKRNKQRKAGGNSRALIVRQPDLSLRPSSVGSHISKCAANYYKALVNPFADFDEYPCHPGGPIRKVKRLRLESEFVLSCIDRDSAGAAQEGMLALMFNPHYIFRQADVVPGSINHTTMWHTQQGTGIFLDGYNIPSFADDMWKPGFWPSAPFARRSDVVDNANHFMQYRVVAAGIEVQYVGDRDNDGGYFYMGHRPDNTTWAGSTLTSDISTTREVTQGSVSQLRRKHITSWHPLDPPQDEEFLPVSAQFNRHPLLLYITGAKIGAPFRIRLIAYYEATGSFVAQDSIRGDFDLIGSHVAKAAAGEIVSTQPARPVNHAAHNESSSNFLKPLHTVLRTLTGVVADPRGWVDKGLAFVGGKIKNLIHSFLPF